MFGVLSWGVEPEVARLSAEPIVPAGELPGAQLCDQHGPGRPQQRDLRGTKETACRSIGQGLIHLFGPAWAASAHCPGRLQQRDLFSRCRSTSGTKGMINPCLIYLHVISLGARDLPPLPSLSAARGGRRGKGRGDESGVCALWWGGGGGGGGRALTTVASSSISWSLKGSEPNENHPETAP